MKGKLTLSVDVGLVEEAKKNGINFSYEMENLLKNILKPKKNKISEKCLKVVCSQCFLDIDEGFKCIYTGNVFCEDCQKEYKMEWCGCHEAEHFHEKW